MARLSEARKEARELLQRAKSAPVRGGARTKLEKRAGALLRSEPLQGLNAAELRARAKTYSSGYGVRLETQASAIEDRARELKRERDRRFREKKKVAREEKRAEEQKARELLEPFGVSQEYEEGRGTGDLVRAILEQAKKRPWTSGPVTIDLKANLGVGGQRCKFTKRLDLAKLTNEEGELLAVQIQDWIFTGLSECLFGLEAEAVVDYRKRKGNQRDASQTPEDNDARAMLETGIRGTVEAFVERFTEGP